MTTTPRRLLRNTILTVTAMLALPAYAVALEGPTMSRYVAHVDTAGLASLDLDLTVIDTLCKDEDGCEVVLSMDSINSGNWIEESRTRLIMATHDPDHMAWSSGGADASDGNAVAENVALVTHGGVSCLFSDAGIADGSDAAPGFSLSFTNTFLTNAVCTLVVID